MKDKLLYFLKNKSFFFISAGSFPTNPTNNQRIPDKIVATGVSYTEQLIERHEGEEIILFCSWNVANQIIGVCINFSLCDNLTASDNLTFSYNLTTAIEEFSNNFTITLEIFDVREDLSVIFSCFNDTTRVNGSLVPVVLKRYFVKFQGKGIIFALFLKL